MHNVPAPRTRRDELETDVQYWRAFADRAREHEGRKEYADALAQLDRARARLDAYEEAHAAPEPTPPHPLWTGAKLLGVVLAVWWTFAAWWHVLVVAALVGAYAYAAWRWWLWPLRQPEPEPVQDRAPIRLAPLPSVEGGPAALPAAATLGAVAEAVVDALPSTPGRKYRDAIEGGRIAEPRERRDEGRGATQYLVQLPGGAVLPSQIDPVRFAAGIGEDAAKVRTRSAGRPGFLVLDVFDVALADRPVPAWPVLGQATSWAAPMPLGIDQDGDPFALDLGDRHVAVFGTSGAGKTATMRLLAAYAASDPRTTLHVLDLKGGTDFAAVEGAAASFWTGAPGRETLRTLDRAVEAMRARYAAIRAERIDPDEVYARLGAVVVLVDEAHHLDAQHWDRVATIAKTGRGAGVVVVGTQSPSTDDVPTRVLGELSTRLTLRLSSSWAAGMSGGDHKLSTGDLVRGEMFVTSRDLSRAVRVRAHYLPAADARAHVAATVADRPTRATDETDDEGHDDEGPDLLADVAAVIGGRPGAPWAEVADALAMPEADVRAALRSRGIGSGVFRDGTGKTVRGVRRADVEAAARA